jgi:hypothetical protein
VVLVAGAPNMTAAKSHEGRAMTPDRDQTLRPTNPARDNSRRFIERHQRSILVGWTLLLLGALLLAAEVFLRFTVSYRLDYYTGSTVSNRLIKYPFGDMPFNSNGYPDREWDRADPRIRVGFWGDSITSGVGAGFAYRYTDIISDTRQDKYYMNFGGPGEDGVADDRAIDKIVELAQRYRLKKIIYAMDLNDLLPDQEAAEARHSELYKAKPLVKQYLDVLRTRSYVYNYVRVKLTDAAVRMGYGYHGDEAFELHPARNAVIVNQTVDRINKLSVSLKRHEVDLCVVLFPYEMQVSADAAARYQQDGVRWSSELLRGEPQKMILGRLAREIVAVDLAPAFHQSRHGPGPIRVGEYFVFNQGDALDWVHPNRDGHRLIAEYLLKNAASCL